ncbi:hypothetical protein TR2A62_2134 [Thalassobium sp. R2A62]|nr:hypothetical protein TR2A62_2134 [Thalassobium sp. R2A62]
MEHNQRLAQRSGIACIKGCVPLFVFLTKTNNDDICVLDPLAGADRINLGTFAIVPEFVILGPENRHATII